MEPSDIMWLLDLAEIERQTVQSRSQRALVVRLIRFIKEPATESQYRAMEMVLSPSGLRRLGYLAQAAFRLGGLKLQSPWLALIERAASTIDLVSVEPLFRSDNRVDEFDQLAAKWKLSTGVDEGLIKQVVLDGSC